MVATDWGLGRSGGGGGAGSRPLALIAGLDITPLPLGAAEAPRGGGEAAVAALVVLSFPALRPAYQDWQEVALTLPYLPSLLGPRSASPGGARQFSRRPCRALLTLRPTPAARECPAYEALLARAAAAGCAPDLLLLNGCGRLHPRRFGLACQLGLAAGLPAVGVAKSLLHCLGEGAPGEAEVRAALQQQAMMKNSAAAAAEAESPVWLPLRHAASGEVLGAAVLAGGSVRPLYVSVGHLVSLETAVAVVAACCRHRSPEPLRAADALSRAQARRLALEREERLDRRQLEEQQQEEMVEQGPQGQPQPRLQDRGQPP